MEYPKPAKPHISKLQGLLRERDRAVSLVEDCEEQLKQAKRALDYLELNLIPAAIDEQGITSETFQVGDYDITCKDTVNGSILKAARPAAHAWLEKNGHGGMVKRKVAVNLGPGELENSEAVKRLLIEAGYSAEAEDKVEPSTISAWIRRRIFAGEHVPEEFFSYKRERRAKIRKKKDDESS